MVMAAKLTRLTHKTAIQLRLVAQSSTTCSSRSRSRVRKFVDTSSYGGVQLYAFITSVVDRDERWVGTRAGLDAVERENKTCLCRESNPGRPARSLVTKLSYLPQVSSRKGRCFVPWT